MAKTAAYLGLLALCVVATGCLGTPETRQLRALNDDLQRRNVELAAEKLRLERELDRLRAENAKLLQRRETTEGKAP